MGKVIEVDILISFQLHQPENPADKNMRLLIYSGNFS